MDERFMRRNRTETLLRFAIFPALSYLSAPLMSRSIVTRAFALAALLVPPLGPLACGDSASLGGDDADGIKGGSYVFAVSVSDSAFTPAIVKAENLATITLTLENAGSTPHGFVVDGIATSRIDPIAPGASATVSFETPNAEGILTFRSTVAADAMTGQLIVQ